ncbi:MAG: SdpI family protein [Oscillospiraceae bacterium]|nr:SdpI family protein [Oscillospiraceae bacterium]
MTHRFAGKLFVIFGICSMLLLLLGMFLDISINLSSVILFLMLCIPCVWSCCYAYQHRNEKD